MELAEALKSTGTVDHYVQMEMRQADFPEHSVSQL